MGTISYQLLICSKLTLCFDVGDIKHSEFSTQRDSHMVERRAFSLSTLYMDAQLHQWEKQCLKKCSPTCLPDQGLGNLLHVNPQSTTMGESKSGGVGDVSDLVFTIYVCSCLDTYRISAKSTIWALAQSFLLFVTYTSVICKPTWLKNEQTNKQKTP